MEEINDLTRLPGEINEWFRVGKPEKTVKSPLRKMPHMGHVF
jgi:hypothetical protein